MRISTANAFEAGLDTLSKRQVELSESQERLTSGKRVAKASDDPAAAARAERALAGIQRSRDQPARGGRQPHRDDANRERAGRCQRTAAGRARDHGRCGQRQLHRRRAASLATKLRSLREQLLGVANRTDGAGGFLFGGQGATTPPFVDAAGGVRLPRRRRPAPHRPGRGPAAEHGRPGGVADRRHRQRRVRDQCRAPASRRPGSTTGR